MPLGDFADPGTVPGPLLIGRAARLCLGAFVLFVFIINLIDYKQFVTSDVSDPDVGFWVAVGFSWWYFADLVVVGFSLRWGRWPQLAVLPVALALAVAGLVAYDSAWAPPLGWGAFIFSEFWFGAASISLLLAGALAVPG